MANKLAPCPFCGAEDRDDNAVQESAIICESVLTPIGKRGYEVRCACGAKGPRSLDYAEAVEKWNCRPRPMTGFMTGFFTGMSKDQLDAFHDRMRRRMGGE